jgi:type IV pilus assembly protein PilK
MVWSLQSAPRLTDQQFDQWSKLLEERAGIYLGDHQRVFLQTQVSMRMRELGQEDYGQYYRRVLDGVSGMVEWSVLIDRLVVKETSFFRHKPSINAVCNYLQQRINNRLLSGSFDVWSVGCASGEEPYSLSMVINDCFEYARVEPYYGITATDISSAALALARRGVYGARKLENLDSHFRQRYFTETDQGKFQINARLKDRVCFNKANVLNIKEMPDVQLDVIFCQNLLVYFRRWLRQEVMNAFVKRLKPGGILVVGLGEAADWTHPRMQRLAVDDVQAYIRK